MKKNFIAVLTSLIVVSSLCAQDVESVNKEAPITIDKLALRIVAPYANPVIYVDSLRFNSPDFTTLLEPGEHRIRIWAPTRILIDSLIKVVPGELNYFKFKLPHSLAYANWHKKEMGPYLQLKSKRVSLSPPLIALCAGGGFVFKMVSDRHYKLAMDAKNAYYNSNSNGGAQNKKEEFYTYRKKFNYSWNTSLALYSLSGLLTVNYIRLIYLHSKEEIPRFHEESPIAKLDGGLLFDEKSFRVRLNYRF